MLCLLLCRYKLVLANFFRLVVFPVGSIDNILSKDTEHINWKDYIV